MMKPPCHSQESGKGRGSLSKNKTSKSSPSRTCLIELKEKREMKKKPDLFPHFFHINIILSLRTLISASSGPLMCVYPYSHAQHA